jgi:hypothetical protein
MARWFENTTIQAAEDLDTLQYHAIALDDAKLANNGAEASGILQNKPKSGDHASIAYVGESRYAAGLAVTKGDKLTVTTSGWLIPATSGSTVVGKAVDTVTSGSYGNGIFSFAAGDTQAADHGLAFTAGEAIGAAGIAIGSDYLVLEAATPMLGVSLAAVAAAATGRMAAAGMAQVRVGGGAINNGSPLVPTTSGYFVAETSSGEMAHAVLLEDTTSGSLGWARLGTHIVNAV